MQTRAIHLAYLSLLLILGLTVALSFPFSLYVFAIIKSLIILFFFMHIQRSDEASRLYIFLAVALMAIIIVGVWDDIAFRGYPSKFTLQELSPAFMESIVKFFGG